ncbi:MAG: right-handed parallel beta-helix repeat-containing protein, partial [Clostridia bacterium]|nr:right-handed parallel beta-helix repeat-containing protein [Clostridia bacterium]
EEVTEPGDYCIDFEECKVYFNPYEDVSVADAEIILSTCDKPVFAFNGSRDITIEGFLIEAFRGMGITADHAENITIKDCEICGIGNRAVCVDNSKNVVVTGCHVHDTGDGGVHFYCGDRKTLERGNCVCEYSHFHNVASWDRCYEPPIRLYGVGLTAHHNKIHDCPHSAMLFGGNYISITDNEVYRVVMETGDAGAIYGGRDYTYRGNEVSRNFIHHVGSSVGMGTMGIYNDDAMSGTRMENNVFYKVQRAVFLGGGVDFIANGNVFVDCYPAIEIDGRGQSDDKMWRNMVIHTLHDRFYNVDGLGISAMEEPYISAFPELAKIDAYYKADPAPHIPPSASMENNILCSERKISYTWCTEGGSFYENNNKDIIREELASYITPEQLDVILNS